MSSELCVISGRGGGGARSDLCFWSRKLIFVNSVFVVRATDCLAVIALLLCAWDRAPSFFCPTSTGQQCLNHFTQHITSLQRRKHIAMGCLSRLALGLLFVGGPLSKVMGEESDYSFVWETGYREVSSD